VNKFWIFKMNTMASGASERTIGQGTPVWIRRFSCFVPGICGIGKTKKGVFVMIDEAQMILREALQLIYEKGQEEGASLSQLLQEVGDVLRPLVGERN
jgi:hypothetical protein